MRNENDESWMVSRRRGSMLIEVCISVIVAGVALISMLGFFTATLQSVFAARDAEASTLMAVEAINDMECLGFGVLSADERMVRDCYGVNRQVRFYTTGDVETSDPENMAYAEITVSVKREGCKGEGLTMSRRVSRNAHRNVGGFK